jgi:hypothetical protein
MRRGNGVEVGNTLWGTADQLRGAIAATLDQAAHFRIKMFS